MYFKNIFKYFFWKSTPNLFQEAVRMIVKTSMHTPDIIITNGTDMKVNFRFYDEVMKENFVYFHGFSIKQSKHHHYKRHHTMGRVIKPSHGINFNYF